MHHCCRRKQQGTSSPARDKPLVDISTNEFRSPDYEKLQNNLLSLSQNSKQSVAEKSGHFIIIDRPDVVIDAVRHVVESARSKSKLYNIDLPKNLNALRMKS